MARHRFYLIALGGNQSSVAGEPRDTLLEALNRLESRGITLDAVSRFYRTPCFPPGAGPDYVNAAARIGVAADAADCLRLLHETEAEFGRERVQRWGRRTLDLDLIAAGDAVIPSRAVFEAWHALPPDRQSLIAPDQPVVPHPRLQDRAFVLIPLGDIAAGWRHPVLGLTVAEMIAALPETARKEVVPL
jgi:2-amino-4-hydroxy-6-hydroxymethyldihydropteridine diphosphokinase